MEINKKQLKTISYNFRIKAKNLLNTDYNEFIPNLKRFLNYIDNEEVINNYINSNLFSSIDVEKEFNEIARSYGRMIFDIGITEKEEVSNIYQILKYICETDYNVFRVGVLDGYTNSNKFQDRIDVFNNRVSNILIQHIETYLTTIAINMGLDEEVYYVINNESGNVQVNIANDNAIINANQNINYNKLLQLAEEIESKLDDTIDEKIKKELLENIECIKDIVKDNEPKKSVITMCKNGFINILPKIAGLIELTASVTSIIEFLSKL